MPSSTTRHLGRQLRKRRRQRDLTQEELGRLIGKSQQQVQKYESGDTQLTGAQLWDLARVLGVRVDYFFEGLEAPAPSAAGDAERAIRDLSNQLAGLVNRLSRRADDAG